MRKQLESAGQTPMHIVLEVPDQEGVQTVLSAVAESDTSVRTKDVVPAARSAGESVTVDVSILTDKQQEALDVALEQGYYEQPRDADLDDLAAELDRSKSAVSQRLRSAETKIITETMHRYR